MTVSDFQTLKAFYLLKDKKGEFYKRISRDYYYRGKGYEEMMRRKAELIAEALADEQGG